MESPDKEADKAYHNDPALTPVAEILQRAGGYPRKPDLLGAFLDSGELPNGERLSKSPSKGSIVSPRMIKNLLRGGSARVPDRKWPSTSSDVEKASAPEESESNMETQEIAWSDHDGSPLSVQAESDGTGDLVGNFAKLYERVVDQERACRSLIAENARLRKFCDVDVDGSLSVPSYEEKIIKLRDQIVQASREKEELIEALRISTERVASLQTELSETGSPRRPTTPRKPSAATKAVLGLIKSADASVEDILALQEDPAVHRMLLRFDRLLRHKEAALEEAHKQNLELAEEVVREERQKKEMEKQAATDRAENRKTLKKAAALERKMEGILAEVAAKTKENERLRERLRNVRAHNKQLEQKCAALKSSSDMKVRRIERTTVGAAKEVESIIMDVSKRVHSSESERDRIAVELGRAHARVRRAEDANAQLQEDLLSARSEVEAMKLELEEPRT